MNPKISIIMGSDSDLETVRGAIDMLKEFKIEFEAKVLSAHRTPKELAQYVESSTKRGVKVLGHGNLSNALKIKLPVSKKALEKIKKAGGDVVV